jgi:hypothetical protein
MFYAAQYEDLGLHTRGYVSPAERNGEYAVDKRVDNSVAKAYAMRIQRGLSLSDIAAASDEATAKNHLQLRTIDRM